jgi:hypothetical protein
MPILIEAPNYTGQILWVVTIAVTVVLFFLVAWILVQLHTHKRKEIRRSHIREEWNVILAGFLMDEGISGQDFELPAAFTAQLKKPFVCSVLASELVRTRQALRGHMAANVVALYNQLGLAACSEQLLNSPKWHLQAKGIQQLSVMEQHQFFDAIYIRVNHPNKWVRNEAQLGMLRLRGTQGIGFLKHLRYPLSEWQQFNLLHQLQLSQTKNLPGLGRWLLSKNNSVVVFSIRLCQMYQLFDYAARIETLQRHASLSVRQVAGECLSHWGFAADAAPVVSFHMPQNQTA